jgi:hypothetical protein
MVKRQEAKMVKARFVSTMSYDIDLREKFEYFELLVDSTQDIPNAALTRYLVATSPLQ